jgi:MFS family permease
VPLGDRFDRRRLILIQRAALTLSLAAAALAPDAWSLVVASALVGGTSSVAQQIVPFAAELAEPSRRGANIGIVMSGLLCGILFGRVLAGAVGDHYGWRAMFWLGLPGQDCLLRLDRRAQPAAILISPDARVTLHSRPVGFLTANCKNSYAHSPAWPGLA